MQSLRLLSLGYQPVSACWFQPVQNFITPLIAAIFAGSNFSELSFYINGSRFNYGE
jgi:hypothetical protein